MTAVRGITFDLWQTLILDVPERGRSRMDKRLEGISEALKDAGEVFAEERVRQGYLECSETCQEIKFQSLDISFMEQIEIFINSVDDGLFHRLPKEAVDRIATCYADAFWHSPPSLHRDAVRVLGGAKSMGYSIGLISNTGLTPGFTFRTFMKQAGILDFFDVLTFSDEIGLSKPSREMFLITARSMNVHPEEVVHIGDDLLNDVRGAQWAGMKAVWISTQSPGNDGQEVKPDATVSSLGQVEPVIQSLASDFAKLP